MKKNIMKQAELVNSLLADVSLLLNTQQQGDKGALLLALQKIINDLNALHNEVSNSAAEVSMTIKQFAVVAQERMDSDPQTPANQDHMYSQVKKVHQQTALLVDSLNKINRVIVFIGKAVNDIIRQLKSEAADDEALSALSSVSASTRRASRQYDA